MLREDELIRTLIFNNAVDNQEHLNDGKSSYEKPEDSNDGEVCRMMFERFQDKETGEYLYRPANSNKGD